MGLVGPWLSTTSTKKHKTKITKSQQEELEQGWRDRNQRLREIKLPKETFEQYMEWVYGRGKKKKTEEKNISEYTQTVPDLAKEQSKKGIAITEAPDIPRITQNKKYLSYSEGIPGQCTKKSAPMYTGSKMIGISQMAKSNAIPVFSKDEIIDIARMRR